MSVSNNYIIKMFTGFSRLSDHLMFDGLMMIV